MRMRAIETCPPLIAGSCAREGREPRQIRKEATVPVKSLCRRGAWLSFGGQGEGCEVGAGSAQLAAGLRETY